MIDEFEAFARVCFERLGKYVNKWLTFNEVNVLFIMESDPKMLVKLHNQMLAAARATIVAHEIDPALKVGCMICGLCSYAYTCDPADQLADHFAFQKYFGYCADTMIFGACPCYAARIQRELEQKLEVSDEDATMLRAGKADFLAYSYYMSATITTHSDGETSISNLFGGMKNPYLETSE